MKNFLVFIVVVAVAIGAVGYYRGWFTVAKEDGREQVQVDKSKFEHDKKAVSKKVGEEAKTLKEKLDHLFEKSKGLTADEQKELDELKKKHERLEQQVKTLEESGEDKFQGIKDDLEKSLADVQKKIDDLTEKVSKRKDK